MQKSLGRKLASIHADPSGSNEFILADAKDADMAFGVGAPGRSPEAHAEEVRFRTLGEFRDQIRQIVNQGLVDIMLMSASTNYLLTIRERLFDNSHVTPAARANDASDVFVVRGGEYINAPSRPFRSATIDHIQCGRTDCMPDENIPGANLGLFSVTFNNRLRDDLRVLEDYKDFRIEAERKGFRHFLEIFDPNDPFGLPPQGVPEFVNDCIARTLAGVPEPGRPIFLKMVYHGPKAMEELVSFDPHLVVGILGGSAGTTYDAFKLLAEAKKYGARAALFGRKINNAECQLAFVEFLRLIADAEISAEEAVKAYHSVLRRFEIKPKRPLEDDMQLTTGVMAYGGSSAAVPKDIPRSGTSSPPNQHGKITNSSACSCGCKSSSQPKVAGGCTTADANSPSAVTQPTVEAKPDFSRMSRAEKLAYNQAQRDRIFGRFN